MKPTRSAAKVLVTLLLILASAITTKCILFNYSSSLPPDLTPKELFDQAGELLKEGRFDEAIKSYDRVADEVGPTDPLAIESFLAAALIADSRLEKEEAQSHYLDVAQSRYLHVLEFGDSEQRLVAANNVGTLWLNEKEFARAATIFGEVEDIDSPDAFVVHYNQARALEGAGQPVPAFDLYLRVLRARPRFTDAANRAMRLAVDSEARSLSRCIDLISQVLQAGRTRLAGEKIAQTMESWGPESKLLSVLLRWCAQAHLSAERLNSGDDPALVQLRQRPEYAEILPDLERIYKTNGFAGNGAPLYSPDPDAQGDRLASVLERLPAFAQHVSREPLRPDSLRRDLARVLKQAGDSFYFGLPAETPDSLLVNAAAARYAAAWILDPRNVQPALYFVELLRRYSTTVEPELYDTLLKILFSAKGGIYSSLQDGLDRDELLNLYYFHWLLAGIFEKEPGRDYGLAGTPEFQFERAIWAEDEIRKFDPSFPASKALREGLVRARKGR